MINTFPVIHWVLKIPWNFYEECPLLSLGSHLPIATTIRKSGYILVGSGHLPWYGSIINEYEIENSQFWKYAVSLEKNNVRNDSPTKLSPCLQLDCKTFQAIFYYFIIFLVLQIKIVSWGKRLLDLLREMFSVQDINKYRTGFLDHLKSWLLFSFMLKITPCYLVPIAMDG